jgi:hypothetical protein
VHPYSRWQLRREAAFHVGHLWLTRAFRGAQRTIGRVRGANTNQRRAAR